MNTHEIERIADSMNRLRPDWPIKQLKTLLSDSRLAERPRRDVCVALAWVACENGTANPYRVLEAGPWWRAAAIEGTAQRREVLAPAERCGVCAKSQPACAATPRIADDDHVFEADFKAKRDGEAVSLIVQSLKAELAPTAEPTVQKSLDDLLPEDRNPNVAAIREQITTTPEEAHA